MNEIDPTAARDFAIHVVRRLREAGFEALWAGGCVRDQLLGLTPKDYDVATNAPPDEVRHVFGRRSTLAIGAAFGVITVLGRKRAGQVEVATFRRDADYSDGRHPDSVSFSSAEEDAQRRDFTINGLFFDPMAERTIDYVGGVRDLERGLVRAIGDPHQRFDEDKLRMLRAVRFAATFGFQTESDTLAAVREHAHELVIVSVERILQELRRMLVHRNRRRAVELLVESELLEVIFPELVDVRVRDDSGECWSRVLRTLESLKNPQFAVGVAAVMRPVYLHDGIRPVEAACRRLRLSNDDVRAVVFCLEHESLVLDARRVPWSKLQRVLIRREAKALVDFCDAIVRTDDGHTDDIDLVRGKLALPSEELNPPPLINGNDLKQIGIPPGPEYQDILTQVRDAQLAGDVAHREDALDLALRIRRDVGKGG